MATIKKPYYTMERSLFRGKVWKEYMGSEGAVPINTPQKMSYQKSPPGTPPLPTPVHKKLEVQKTEQAQNKQPPSKKHEKHEKHEKPKIIDVESKEKLPDFDVQDIPDAMDKMGWPVAAKVARKWFASPKNVWDNDPNSTQPIDSSIMSIEWALKHGNIKDKFNELLNEAVYSTKVLPLIKEKILRHATKIFTETQDTRPNLSLDTTVDLPDLKKFHTNWQVQQKKLTTLDTLNGLLMTDISAALGNFVLYAAIGKAEVKGDRYFDYAHNPYQYCTDAIAHITHIYIYLKDNYSFNDKDPSNSQYLGHWNKRDMILSYTVAANDLLGQYIPEWKIKSLNDSNEIETKNINWDYLINRKEVNKPIDKRTGVLRKFIEKDIYWPVYNKSYNEWREQHNRGGDFMVYSKPRLYKLKKPITMKLGTICRPYGNIFSNQ